MHEKGWKDVEEKKEKRKYLGSYEKIEYESDWWDGFEYCMKQLEIELDLGREVLKRVDIVKKYISKNRDDFFVKSRLSVASAAICLAWELTEPEKEKQPIRTSFPVSRTVARQSMVYLREKLEEAGRFEGGDLKEGENDG